MDIQAVKGATRQQLLDLTAAIARNGNEMLSDAEFLSAGERYPRAYALGALAVEELGKAVAVMMLAMMPDDVRAHAPVKALLDWHLMKQNGALLMTTLGFGSPPGGTELLGSMPVAAVAQVLTETMAQAQGVDLMKKRGLYADMGPAGEIWEPGTITRLEAQEQLGRARDVAAAAERLLAPDFLAVLAAPPAWVAGLASDFFGEWLGGPQALSAEQAAEGAVKAAARALERVRAAGLDHAGTGELPSG
jgi:AbiV family abortive infection protein